MLTTSVPLKYIHFQLSYLSRSISINPSQDPYRKKKGMGGGKDFEDGGVGGVDGVVD